MLPGPFALVRRSRPVRLVSDLSAHRSDDATDAAALDPRVPSRAVEVAVGGRRTTVALMTPALRVEGWYDATSASAGLDLVGADGTRERFTSRASQQVPTATNRLALTLTGRQVTVLTRTALASEDKEAWTVRARVDLAHTPGPGGADRLDPSAGLVTDNEVVREGRFGHLGLRDLHLVTHADGGPFGDGDLLFFTATHAGPGFFATAHCGVWSFDPATLEMTHVSDLWFERDGAVWGDHAVHLLRDGDHWLVAASTWGDFDHDDVGITISRTDADLLQGEHVLRGRALDLGDAVTHGVGAWDPHLTRIDGIWHLAFVVASEFFVFRPALARAHQPGFLDDPTADAPRWQLLGDAADRTATEGTQIVRIDGQWLLLASDGRDNPARLRERFPVFDLTMREIGTLEAPYPSNLPWPSLLEHDGRWLMVTFDGTPHGGRVAGYGTHGDVLVFSTSPCDQEVTRQSAPAEGS